MSAATVKPLAGKRIVVTRSPELADEMAQKFAALGAHPICLPVIKFVPLPAPELDNALNNLSQYHWLIFTSPNAVRFLFAKLEPNPQSPITQSPHQSRGKRQEANPPTTTQPLNHSTTQPNHPITQSPITNHPPLLAAVGQSTARLLAEKGISIDFMPDEFTGQQLALGLGDVTGQRILLPRAKIGRPEIVNLLRQRGAVVDDIALYDTITATPDPATLAEIEKGVDVITFTSPSSVRNFLKIVSMNSNTDDADGADDAELNGFERIFQGVLLASIGPSTAEEVEKQGLTADIVAQEYTIDGLVTAVTTYYEPN